MNNKKCTLILSNNFKRQYKKIAKQGKDLDKIDEHQIKKIKHCKKRQKDNLIFRRRFS